MSAGGETNTAREKRPAEPGATMWSRMLGQPKLMPNLSGFCDSATGQLEDRRPQGHAQGVSASHIPKII
eukprot:5346062-Alexandrium_andersonii.AAC.1